MRTKLAVCLMVLWSIGACGDDDGGGAAETITQLIGPEGGTVELSSGGKVEIPAGALDEDESITITKLNDADVTLPSNLEAAGKPYAFKPHGLTFAIPVKIELPYTGSDDNVRPVKRPNEDPEDSTMWTTVAPSEKDTANNKVSGDVTSFSVLIAARPNRNSTVITLLDGAIDDGSAPDGGAGSGGTGGAAGDAGSGGTGGMDAGVDAGGTSGGDAAIDAGNDAGMAMSKAQDGYIKASNAETYDLFGTVVALSGDTLVVGAPGESSDGTGDNNNVGGSGAAYVFVYAGGAWTQQALLKADNPTTNAKFGCDVGIDGDTIVVGSSSEDSGGSDSGAAYVFDRSGTTWAQTTMLKASNAGGFDEYGISVAISGDTIVVGASREDSIATGVNNADPGPNDESWNAAGAAYVYTRATGTWSQQAYLKPSHPGVLNEFNEAAGKEFGYDVAIDGDTIVVGAPGDDTNSTGVNGAQDNNLGLSNGAAYIFARATGVWTEQAYLKTNDGMSFNYFGSTVAVSGDIVAVGRQDSNSYSGGVYTFTRSGSTWSVQQTVLGDVNTANHNFGAGLALEGDRMLVGVHGADGSNRGVNTPYTCCTMDSGAAFEFVLSGNTWTQVSYIKASNPDYNDWFGYRAVAISGGVIAVGAASESSNSTGINGAENNNSALAAGAVYTFR